VKSFDEDKNNFHNHAESLLFQSILDSAQDIIVFALDLRYCYTAFTKFHKTIMKTIWNVDIQIGMSILDVISSSEDRKKAKANFDRALNGERFILEEEYGDENLLRTFYRDYYNPIINSKGNIIGVSIFVIDLTKNKLAEKTLAESEEKYRTLTETAGDIIITYTPTGSITYLNQAGLSFASLTKEDYLGKNLLQFIPQKYHETLARNFRERQEGFLGRRIFEIELLDKNNKLIPFEVASSPVLSNGIIKEFITIARDITERKLSEEKLRTSERKYRMLVENAHDLVFTINVEGVITYVSPSAKEFGGYDEGDGLGQHFSEFVADKSQLEYLSLGFKEIIELKKKQVIELLYLPKNRKPFWTEVTANPMIENNQVSDIYCVLRNIEERKKAEEKINAQLLELQKWYASTLGREERIIEMKKEVNALLKQLGKQNKYNT